MIVDLINWKETFTSTMMKHLSMSNCTKITWETMVI
uniref:Uncharacterized protein n=1 Tax=Romanomermis culicivorax TaxID=13658 RepID=A0A915JKN1_ROMCU